MPQEIPENMNISTIETPPEPSVSPDGVQEGFDELSVSEQIQDIHEEQTEADKLIEDMTQASEGETEKMEQIRQKLGLSSEADVSISVTERDKELNKLRERKEELEKQRDELLNKQEKERRVEEEKQRILTEKIQKYFEQTQWGKESFGRSGAVSSGGGSLFGEAPRPVPEEIFNQFEAEALEEAIKIIEREIMEKEEEIIKEEKGLEEKTDELPVGAENVVNEENLMDNEVVPPVSSEIK